MSVAGSIAGIVFSYREPLLGLPPGEQLLLTAALTGLTDEELATELRIKLPTIKKRWASIYSRVSSRKPDLLPACDHETEMGVARGRQKRHRLLAYIREHREELRPTDLTARPIEPSHRRAKARSC